LPQAEAGPVTSFLDRRFSFPARDDAHGAGDVAGATCERLDVTFQQLQKYEVGANRIGTGRLVRVAAVLGIPIATLFDGADTDPSRSLLALVSDARAFRVAQAFAAIHNSNLRLSLVYLVEKVAAAVPHEAKPNKKRGRRKKKVT
jgi:transcriptional regulator with XRE-family HTH domain